MSRSTMKFFQKIETYENLYFARGWEFDGNVPETSPQQRILMIPASTLETDEYGDMHLGSLAPKFCFRIYS